MLSIPAHHPYVAAVDPGGSVAVAAERVSGFEPDPFFVPAVVTALAGAVDVVHLHFGFDHLDPAAAQAWCAALRRAEMALVLTVHDLRNPHHADRSAHDAVLAVLVPAADAVLTLTPGAAAEIAARFGRTAQVVTHPSLADPARTADVTTEPGLVVVHLKSLRANLVEPLAVVGAAARGAIDAGGRLRVDLHPEIVDDPRLGRLPQLAAAGVEVRVHDRFDDPALERYLRRAQVTVLPHRWGTHSGWLELARDLGTAVVAPNGGYYADQWDQVVGYSHDETSGLDAESLRTAVAQALRRPRPAPLASAERTARAAQVRAAHAAVYGDVLVRARSW